MAIFKNKEILININELPQINGVKIKSIYKTKYDKRGIKDYIVRDNDASIYYHCIAYFNSDKDQNVRILPNEIQKIFDNPQKAFYLNHEKNETTTIIVHVSSLWFRTSCSGNGSFIDSSIYLTGSNGSQSSSISVTRNDKYKLVTEQSGIYDKLIKMLNIKAKIPVLREDEYTYYPSITLRNVDGLFYPTPVCSGWRRHHEMPFTTIDNKKSIRVLNELLQCHVYFLKVEADELVEGDEYHIVNFNHQAPNYCFIRSWNNSKENDKNGMIRHRIDKINTKHIHCTVIGQNIKRFQKEKYEYNPFYKIVRINNVEDLNN